MSKLIRELAEFCGVYKGTGTNHDNQKFHGEFELVNICASKGLLIKFSAFAAIEPRAMFHSETSMITPNLEGSSSLFNFNTNTPFLIELKYLSDSPSATGRNYVFRYGDPADQNAFREEIRIEITKQNQIGYHYSWGMPGQEYAYRSGLLMDRCES